MAKEDADLEMAGDARPLQALLDASVATLSWTPRLIDKGSSWWEHVPFAFWVMTVAKPGVFVELGSHNGASYAAFCEAVVRGGLPTRCFAVDTWKGDPQAGFYDESAFADLNALNAEHYARFSRLLRMTFDEAVDEFADGTVDLLHIDGLHTYEAVSHDFETWRPKLSERGVVLFHDTNVQRSDFGVGRLFRPLSEDYPSFEFLHGHGLGVLAVGSRPPPVIAALCAGLTGEAATAVRDRFHEVGRHWSTTHGLTAEARFLRELLLRELAPYIFHRVKAEADALQRAPRRGLLRDGEEARDAALIRGSFLFDAKWYGAIAAAGGGDAAEHFLKIGGPAGRDPSPLFSTSSYLDAVGLKQGEANPLVHFLKYGDYDDFCAAISLQNLRSGGPVQAGGS